MTDPIEQTRHILAACHCPAQLIAPAWFQYWIDRGKSPMAIASIAIGTQFRMPR